MWKKKRHKTNRIFGIVARVLPASGDAATSLHLNELTVRPTFSC